MKIPTGIEGLDHMLKGGLIGERNILLSGPCGSGKSTLAMQFLYNGAVKFKEPGLYITLEEPAKKLYLDMKNLDMDLEELEKTDMFTVIGGPVTKLNGYMKKVDATVDNIAEEIEEVIKEKGIKRVVVDSINLLTVLSDDKAERRNALAMIANTLSTLKCTSLLISETKEGSMDLSRYGIEEFVVDGVIVLYIVRQEGKFISGITIRKMRGSDHDKEIRYYQLSDKGVKVYPEETVFTK